MKTIYLSIVLLLAGTAIANAQKGFHVGLEGAYNATFIINQDAYGEQELDYAATTGFAGGLAIGYNIDNHFGLQLEAVSSNQGQHYIKQTANEPTIYRNIDLNYMHFPLLLKYSGGAQYATRFFVMAGPEMSMLQKANLYYKDGTSSYTIDVKNRFNKQDWAMVFELGADFTIYKGLYASAGIRLNYGLTDINDPAYRIPNHNGIYDASRNAWGGINIGLHYVFGHND